MNENDKNESADSSASTETSGDAASEQRDQGSTQGGPKFTDAPDPLAGVKKTTSDLMANMEGKTVSLKLYIGTIIAVVVLMLLARCGA